jgi:hypothetical protein
MSSAAAPNPSNKTTQATYVEEPAMYTFNYTLTADQAVQRVPVNIDRDSDFLLTGINGSSTGTYTLNVRLPSGRLIASAQINNTNFIGAANQPTAIGPPPIYRAGSTGPELDLTDTSGAGNTLQIIFQGIRRIRTA